MMMNFYKMKKGFSVKKDGFTGNKWHSICDNKGKTLVIIKTKENYIFGGFTQVGFTTDKSKWKEKDINKRNGGPCFGRSGGIWLNYDFSPFVTSCGEFYTNPKGIEPNSNEAKSYLAGSYDEWKVDEIETYFI
ncbi:hypothetical protein M0811_07410 [Anaeramoeba ignava]|uniref:TLDc domain-containing protein n=1 Tax=Anaeramoeba ignava TaxID=1746090 RepID=A0A9Q0LQJ5_ANAIG|nr:hypothetical protein M0811_07410 [Anaeramoeba ignava]